jgi:hypothetical protein
MSWVRSRQEQLEADLVNAWRRDLAIVAESEVRTEYAGKMPALTHSFYGQKIGGAGGNRTRS